MKTKQKRIWILVLEGCIAYIFLLSFILYRYIISPENSIESKFWLFLFINIILVPQFTIFFICVLKRKELFPTEKQKCEEKGIPYYTRLIRKIDKIRNYLLYSGSIIVLVILILLIVYYLYWQFFITIGILKDNKTFEKFLNIFSISLLPIAFFMIIIVGIRVVKKDEKFYSEAIECFELSKFNEAIFLLERVIEINPNSEQAWYLLGASYYNIQYYENALEACNRSIKINPNFNYAKELLEKIQNKEFKNEVVK